MTDIERLKKAFKSLQLPIEFRAVPVYGDEAKYAISVYGDVVTYIDPNKGTYESWVASTLNAVTKAIYKRIRRRVKDKKALAYSSYYYIVGSLGAFIRSDIPETSRKTPKWMKRHTYFGSPLIASGIIHVDHTYFSREGAYVSEPYTMGLEDFENLIHFCRENGLTFHVRGESRHFPGHTFRVVIKEAASK